MPRRLAFLLLPLLVSCVPWKSSVHPEFAQSFIDLNRHGDDLANVAVFEPQLRILAVGHESGRVELWDTTKPNARVVIKAHAARAEFIAFGREEGIVLTNSAFSDALPPDPNHGTRIWDARTGQLIHSLKGMMSPGPIAAAPSKGLFLIGDTSNLLIYDHAKRSLVGDSVHLEHGAQVSAIASDPESGLIAVGTSRGNLLLMKLILIGEVPKLETIRQASPYGDQVRRDVRALMFLDEGKRLVSVANDEVVSWNTSTLERERQFPTTLVKVRQGTYTTGEPWLVIAGLESTRGRIELVDLRNGVAWRYRANTTHPTAVLLPEIRAGLILQSGGATRIKYLDQKE